VKSERSPGAFDEIEVEDGGLLRYAYRLREPDQIVPPFYGFAFSPDGGQLVIAAFFDRAELVEDAVSTWRSIAWTG
jgi:hypothetical protein